MFSSQKIPLCVDLDGTLIKTDIFIESLVSLIKNNIFYLFCIPIWLLGGKAYLKRQVARRVPLKVSSLPYNRDFMQFLKNEKDKRQIILATASDELVARKVAEHVGFFSDVLASDGRTNLSGRIKLKVLQEKFGENGFDYAGNACIDLEIWKHANNSIVVNPSKRLHQKTLRISNVSKVFSEKKNIFHTMTRVLRLHQWAKNILVFVPLILAHNILNLYVLRDGILSFFAFSFCASSAYIVNDLMDLDSDRIHGRKKYRPFAAGELSLLSGIIIIPFLILVAIAISLTLSMEFVAIIVGYFFLTVLYSFFIKKIVLVDVIVLASLYTIRIIAGAIAMDVAISPWLLAFSMFFFLSMAFVKRYSELHILRNGEIGSVFGRGYLTGDIEQIAALGTASGYISVMVMALYINGKEVMSLYTKPNLLWFVCPLLLYWISRVWLLATRGHMEEDPIVFALKDKVSYLTGAIIAIVIILAI